MKINALGYLRVESPDAKEWAQFGSDVLGLMITDSPEGHPDTVSLTPDDRPGRLQVSPGERNRLECVGWEVPNATAFDEAVAELESAGVEVSRATDEDRARAGVRDLVRFTDPAGHTHEIFWGQLVVPLSFRPGRAMKGFVTGSQGLGHLVLIVPDLIESLDFFRSVLGFTVSDEIDLHGNRVVFLHVNPRHHTLALIGIPGHRGLHHLMVQTEELDDVGTAYDRCLKDEIPLAMTLGRHTNDKMVSFYVRSPSGFDVEYGWGADTVDDESAWTVTHMKSPSTWGHRPGGAPAPACIEPIAAEEPS
ncbi:VOC family protein [Streptomyces sp. GQFP]|uniref:VOC family protein n=1 Tax=Streptomyces sp. GQFP TaxID=2907545 RepID=UPI001F1A0697|nr:VOC family protein [Streptomyces sp. GQFP]UIX29242.1 VOC family protein [Streptomyces sp. GQFP]